MWYLHSIIQGHGGLCVARKGAFYNVCVDILTPDFSRFEGEYEFPYAIEDSNDLLMTNHEVSQVALRFHYVLHYDGKTRKLITFSGRCRGRGEEHRCAQPRTEQCHREVHDIR